MNLKKKILIRDKVIEEKERPYIIAEMACAHEGQVERAKKLIDVAVQSGADAIQFEIFDPDDNIVPQLKMYSILKKLYFFPDQWKDLFNYARQFDIAISTFAYDYKSLELALRQGSDLIKLNSSDLSNPDMIIKIAQSRLPYTLGTGASTMEEICKSIELSLKHGGDKLILMHGVQNFPTDINNLHINRLNILRTTFDCLVGYADHTEAGTDLSPIIDLIALGMGACVIEKHITLDRSEKGIDHESALEPEEFMKFIKRLNNAYKALGPKTLKSFNESDLNYRLFQKKTVVATRNLKTGDTLRKEMIKILRNSKEHGISPMDVKYIIGKTISKDIKKYEPIKQSDVT